MLARHGLSGLMLLLLDELNGALAAPSRLMEFGRDAVLAGPQGVEVTPLPSHPICVVVSFLPVVSRGMAETPKGKTIVQPRFRSVARAL